MAKPPKKKPKVRPDFAQNAFRVMQERTVAVVRWFDASYQRGECTDADLVPRLEIESAGLLVCEDEDSISIALDRYDADGLWRYIEHIPKVNVRHIRRVKV